MTNRPAASSKLHPFGTGRRVVSGARTWVAYAPCVAPKTRSPTRKRGEGAAVGTAAMMPANSAPPTQGSGGWCWYLPWIWRMSKKFVPAEWISMRYLSAEGVGVGTSETVRSSGPWEEG